MSMPKVLVFDLDDTLFDEISYVKSGLRSVANWVSQKRGIDESLLYGLMMNALTEGRSNIFDKAFSQMNIYSSTFVKEAVRRYRCHLPDINLKPEAIKCLDRFKEWPKFLVTDGNKTAQSAKVKALELDKYFLFTYITYRYGHRHSKPSPYCFFKICERLNVLPIDVVYIGDNPTKDFKGISPYGFKTIRVLTGQHKNIKVPAIENADFEIDNLSCLTEELMRKKWT